MMSSVEEVRARDGRVIASPTRATARSAKADWVIAVPAASGCSPILTVLPLQLLAYHVAVRQGTDVDQPRNLAKSVTVE